MEVYKLLAYLGHFDINSLDLHAALFKLLLFIF